MQENIDLVLKYVRMMWRFRWTALVTAALVCAGGWAAIVLLPDKYEVKAKVFFDTRSLLRPLLKGLAVQSNMQRDTVMLMRRTLLVRPNLEAIARKTDMDLEAKTPEDFERIIVALAERVSVTGTVRDNIFVITYSNRDPKLATRVVEALLNIFVEKALGDTRKDTGKTRQFLETQIREYEARLLAAEDRLKEFKRQNVGMMPQSGQTYYGRLEKMAEQLAQAKLEVEEGKRRRDQIHKRLKSVDRVLSRAAPKAAAAGPDPTEIRVATLQAELDRLLVRYTDRHPDVTATRRLLEEAQAAQQAKHDEEPEDQASAPAASQMDNPVYMGLAVSLSAAEGEVAALEARVEEFERRRVSLEKLVDTIPKVEAEFKKLDRDYAVVKTNYNELLKRREQLKMSDDADQTSDNYQFNIIEPPRVPLIPIGPNRPQLSAGVLGGGVGVGIGLAVLLAFLRPTVYTRQELEDLTGLPVLGSVSRLWTRRERWRRRLELLTFTGGGVALAGMYGGLVLLFTLHIDIVAKVLEIGRRFL